MNCQYLDHNLKRCRKPAKWSVVYHGDDEIYRRFTDNDVTCVRVFLCDSHVTDRASKRIAK